MTYTAVLTPGEDGFVCAQIAEVPEAISQGRTAEEAKANVPRRLSWRSSGAVRRGNRSPSPLRSRSRPSRYRAPESR